MKSGSSAVIRRYRRFKHWDYEKGASLFITIATEPRRPAFGLVERGRVSLSPLGEVVADALASIPRLNHGVRLYGSVVMPDHIHFNCSLSSGLKEPLKVLGGAVRRFKNYTTAMAKRSLAVEADGQSPSSQVGRTAFGQTKLWQQGYHDYLLVSRQMIDSTERYIAYNQQKWELMHGKGSLRIEELLSSPRLDVGDYWKGVGNVALLAPEERLVSLRVSREVVEPRELARLLAKMESAAENGWVIVSGFISKGEQAVRDMLCRKKGAKFVRVRPSCIPNSTYRPESVYIDAFSENRYLEIGRGNDEVAFGRSACLDLNAEIIDIAISGEGMALYWKPSGPQVLAKGETRWQQPR